jgi:hypothetical protein
VVRMHPHLSVRVGSWLARGSPLSKPSCSEVGGLESSNTQIKNNNIRITINNTRIRMTCAARRLLRSIKRSLQVLSVLEMIILIYVVFFRPRSLYSLILYIPFILTPPLISNLFNR